MTIETTEIIIEGVSPLVTVPIGIFKLTPDAENEQFVRAALELYRRADGEEGFPAGAFKDAILEAVRGEKEGVTKKAYSVIVLGEEDTAMVSLKGSAKPEPVVFKFKIGKSKKERKVCLPRYAYWRATLRVMYDNSVVTDLKEIEWLLDKAGAEIGVGHGRPENGKFRSVVLRKSTKPWKKISVTAPNGVDVEVYRPY